MVLFLHADCRLPAGWFPALETALSDPETAMACFRLRTEPIQGSNASGWRSAWLRILDLRSRTPALPYGDQGYGLRRADFIGIGGFPEIPLMEDVALAERCRRRGRIRRIPLEVSTTARRFQKFPVRSRLMTASFPALYRLGVPPGRLAEWYRHVR
jgi:hypothetical protein